MDRQPPTTFYDSELDDSSSSASSPLSVSSVDTSSPYDGSRLTEEDPDGGSLSATSIGSHSPERSSATHNYYASRSVRWFRDDRGLWSERSSCVRRSSTPYSRGSPCKSRPDANHVSEVLIEAVRRSDQAKLHQLLSKSAASINQLGHEGDSPLHRSCRLGNLDAVKLLVRYGADTELTNREGWSPLHLAVHSGFQEVAVYLLSIRRR